VTWTADYHQPCGTCKGNGSLDIDDVAPETNVFWLAGVYSWESQCGQYPERGPKGISYFRGEIPELQQYVDCLLYRDENGALQGILNHYPFDNDWETKGNFNIWVAPGHFRQGIGTALLGEAVSRWDIDFHQQKYSEAGAALVNAFLRKPCPVCAGSGHDPDCAGCQDETIYGEHFEHHGTPPTRRS
jgi:GNAT superfamily N-acetyltransferase